MRVRRMMLGSEFGEMGLRYKIGEIEGNGRGDITIEHGLGEVPLLFAMITDVTGEEDSGTTSTVLLNTGLKSRYTTTFSKNWSEVGNIIASDEVNDVTNINPTSAVYGIQYVDDNKISINPYGSKQYFLSGKVYKWIAVADWR